MNKAQAAPRNSACSEGGLRVAKDSSISRVRTTEQANAVTLPMVGDIATHANVILPRVVDTYASVVCAIFTPRWAKARVAAIL